MKIRNVYTDELMRLAWGTDASFYHMVPQEVVRSESEEEVAEVLRRCFAEGRAVTFRAAGTSLSGQALSDSVLLVAPFLYLATRLLQPVWPLITH